MAKGKISKAEEQKRLLRNKKARERRAAKKAAEEAARLKRQIRNKIAYRNSRLRKITIYQQDEKDLNRYLKELRELYKEQNPKKNKKLTKTELAHVKNFRDFADNQLDQLLKKPKSYFENLTEKGRKEYLKKLKYFRRISKKYNRLVEKAEKKQKAVFAPEEFEEESRELLDEKRNLLMYQLVEYINDDVKDPFWKSIDFYFNDDLFDSIQLSLEERTQIILALQKFDYYVLNNYYGDYIYYNIAYYSTGEIEISSSMESIKNKKRK